MLGYIANIDGECVPVDAEVIGDFGPNVSDQAPSSTLDSPETVTVTGFEGTLEVDVDTTGSGAAAVVQALREGSWQTVTSVIPGDELRVRVVAPPGNGQSRAVTVTLFVGPTYVWTSPAWALSTWTYSASGVSYGSCSATCGGGSRSPISWTCSRSDGTSGHSSGNCSAGGSRSCNMQSCPFPSGGQVYPSGDRTRINDPNTNSPRYEIQCRNGGNGGTSNYTVVSPASTSVNSSQRQVTIFLYNGGTTRRGYVRFRFNATSSGLRVSSFQPGAGTHHGYLCYNPSFSEAACNPRASIIDPNCSSRIFCRMRDLWTGSTIWSNSLYQTRALPCNGYGGGPFPPQWNSW